MGRGGSTTMRSVTMSRHSGIRIIVACSCRARHGWPGGSRRVPAATAGSAAPNAPRGGHGDGGPQDQEMWEAAMAGDRTAHISVLTGVRKDFVVREYPVPGVQPGAA